MSDMTNTFTYDRSIPKCSKHDEQMVLFIYDRLGSPPGTGWGCRSCANERSAPEQPPTRWGEGAEQ